MAPTNGGVRATTPMSAYEMAYVRWLCSQPNFELTDPLVTPVLRMVTNTLAVAAASHLLRGTPCPRCAGACQPPVRPPRPGPDIQVQTARVAATIVRPVATETVKRRADGPCRRSRTTPYQVPLRTLPGALPPELETDISDDLGQQIDGLLREIRQSSAAGSGRD